MFSHVVPPSSLEGAREILSRELLVESLAVEYKGLSTRVGVVFRGGVRGPSLPFWDAEVEKLEEMGIRFSPRDLATVFGIAARLDWYHFERVVAEAVAVRVGGRVADAEFNNWVMKFYGVFGLGEFSVSFFGEWSISKVELFKEFGNVLAGALEFLSPATIIAKPEVLDRMLEGYRLVLAAAEGLRGRIPGEEDVILVFDLPNRAMVFRGKRIFDVEPLGDPGTLVRAVLDGA